MNLERLTPIARGVLTGLLILATGFGVIFSAWQLGEWPSNVPGFWDYRTPWLGDGLILPILVGVLVASTSSLEDFRKAEDPGPMAATWGGMGVGAVTQGLWLLDPDPVPNWSAPAAHTFNSVGIYHAIFFVATSGVIARQGTILILRLRAVGQVNPGHAERLMGSPIVAVLVGCILAFVGLVALDGYGVERLRIHSSVTGLSALISAGVAASVFFSLAAASLGIRMIMKARVGILWGIALAVATTLAAWHPRSALTAGAARDSAAISLALIATIGCWVNRRRSPYWSLALCLSILLAVALATV